MNSAVGKWQAVYRKTPRKRLSRGNGRTTRTKKRSEDKKGTTLSREADVCQKLRCR